jgi:hypothetical protein
MATDAHGHTQTKHISIKKICVNLRNLRINYK